MNTFLRLLRYSARHGRALSLPFAIALLGVGFELIKPWPIKLIVDHVLGDLPPPDWLTRLEAILPGADSPIGLVIWLVAALGGVAIGAAAASYLGLIATVRICYRVVYDLSCDLFDKLQRLSLSYHQRQSVGDLLQRMSGDVFSAHAVVSDVLLPVTVSLLSLAGMFIIMVLLDPVLACIAMLVVPALGVVVAVFARPLQSATRGRYDSHASLMSLVHQSLVGIRVVQGFAREAYLQDKMRIRARHLGEAYNRDVATGAAYREATTLTTALGAAAVLGIGAARVIGGDLTLGGLLVFLGYLAALYGPVNAVSLAVGAAVVSTAQAKRVFEVLDADEEVPVAEHPIQTPALRGEVTFESVTFGYGAADAQNARPVLDDVSFHAVPGQVVAIVGATGVGKSTLISLLLRFHDPWTGRILIDGHDVRNLPLAQVRESISLVLQDAFLFPLTVAENIAFGQPTAAREQIEAAAHTAQAHEFISRLPQGYDTLIGEQGVNLSGGERQRIAIARAVFKQSPILILDEPTSALDARTEAHILQALSESARRRTTFVVSHRLTTIRRADQIIVIEQGQVVERGTHDQLLATGVVYPQLYRHQELAVL